MTYEKVYHELKECYDGYHLVENSVGIIQSFQFAEYIL